MLLLGNTLLHIYDEKGYVKSDSEYILESLLHAETMLPKIVVSNVGLGLQNARKLCVMRQTCHCRLSFCKKVVESSYAAFYHFRVLNKYIYQNGRAKIARDVMWHSYQPSKLSLYSSKITSGMIPG